ncbi:MAG TPA: SPOR domain-containing protein [Gemmatimonadaceae bacterium]
MSRWLAEGRTLGASLRRFTSVVVAGPDRDATADVALGIAEVQAETRRVILGDLLDDAERFASLRSPDDHHGLVDSLHYGISLPRIVRPVGEHGRLFFAASGSHIVDYQEVLSHPRWAVLTAAVAAANELLVVAAPASAPGLDDLARRTDGVVLVDGQVPATLDPTRVIAHIRAAPIAPPPTIKRPSIVPAGAAASAAAPGTLRPAAPPSRSPAKRPPSKARVAPAPIPVGQAAGKPIPGLNRAVVLGSLITLVVSLFVYWLAERPAAEPVSRTIQSKARLPDTSKSANAVNDPNVPDPADSGASAYAVQIMAANTRQGAILKLQERGLTLSAATYAPVAIQGTTWFKVLAGAFPTRGGADSLLTSLRTGKLLDSTEGVVVHVPYSLRIDSVPPAATVNDYLAQLRVGRNLPVYALVQHDRWVWIMVGAFETRSQADEYAETLRSVGLTPAVVLRSGRPLQ